MKRLRRKVLGRCMAPDNETDINDYFESRCEAVVSIHNAVQVQQRWQ